MSEKEKEKKDDGKKGGAAVAEKPKASPPKLLPQFKVLHNDDKNDFLYVVDAVIELVKLKKQDATEKTMEAHKKGLALLTITHKERAELYKDQFESKKLTVTIEPAE